MTTKALHITSEGQCLPLLLDEDTAHLAINEVVGGWFDSVSENGLGIVGYINDEGLLIGLPMNAVASALFGRPLAGDCVVIGALNEQGEYDGENHDVPDFVWSEQFAKVAQAVLADTEYSQVLNEWASDDDNFAPKVIGMDDEQMDNYFATGELPNG
jgi:Domain of unknown function (DUF3846)